MRDGGTTTFFIEHNEEIKKFYFPTKLKSEKFPTVNNQEIFEVDEKTIKTLVEKLRIDLNIKELKKNIMTNNTHTLKQRLYSLVLYSLSGIQKGIQMKHSSDEYAIQYWDNAEFQQWILLDKTVVLLDGGSTNDTGFDVHSGNEYVATMQLNIETLKKNKIPFASFKEPDLGNSTTSVSFLVDERVWDWKNYPDLSKEMVLENGAARKINSDELYQRYFSIYGPEIAFLKTWLPNFRLASN